MVGNELVNDYEGLASYEQLNLYRNRYYNDGSVTERGIIANAINDILPKYCKQQEEIERLMSYISDHHWDLCSIAGCEGASNDCWKTCPSSRYNKVKSEAVKEFVDRLKEVSSKITMCDNGTPISTSYQISSEELDSVLKEIVSENNA